jgi:hypothetical protein
LRWGLEPELDINRTTGVVHHEGRDICPINDDTLVKPVEELDANQCYPVDDVWNELDQLQMNGSKNVSNGNMGNIDKKAPPQQLDEDKEIQTRIFLRDLYHTMVNST